MCAEAAAAAFGEVRSATIRTGRSDDANWPPHGAAAGGDAMKVLVVGQGGREHALAWRLAKSSSVDRVFVAPGNAGTEEDAENVPIASDDVDGLLRFAKAESIDLTVVGPEAPLVIGLVDRFRAEKLNVFGPTEGAARLEGSKAFCKEVCRAGGIPTGDAWVFDAPDAAIQFLNDREDQPIVVKASGLAAGKGVFVCDSRAIAIEAIREMQADSGLAAASAQILIEERLTGQEISVFALTDGQTVLPLEASQDHKAAYDGDRGPNTGGMGAYTPTPFASAEIIDRVTDSMLLPTVIEMQRRGMPFTGVLYAGVMLTPQGPRLLEYNVRFGDPECQPLMMRLRSDLGAVLDLAARRKLDDAEGLRWDRRPAVCVVMASEGYPGGYEKGHPIRGLDAAAADDVKVFHAGTRRENGEVVNAGGRVLGVTALGDDVASAKRRAYEAVKPIRWQGAWCRKDIADKAVRS